MKQYVVFAIFFCSSFCLGGKKERHPNVAEYLSPLIDSIINQFVYVSNATLYPVLVYVEENLKSPAAICPMQMNAEGEYVVETKELIITPNEGKLYPICLSFFASGAKQRLLCKSLIGNSKYIEIMLQVKSKCGMRNVLAVANTLPGPKKVFLETMKSYPANPIVPIKYLINGSKDKLLLKFVSYNHIKAIMYIEPFTKKKGSVLKGAGVRAGDRIIFYHKDNIVIGDVELSRKSKSFAVDEKFNIVHVKGKVDDQDTVIPTVY